MQLQTQLRQEQENQQVAVQLLSNRFFCLVFVLIIMMSYYVVHDVNHVTFHNCVRKLDKNHVLGVLNGIIVYLLSLHLSPGHLLF